MNHPPILDRLVRDLSSMPEVRAVILFGSRARGDAQERSDIDLAVEAPAATQRQWLDIAAAADDADTLLDIDIVRLEEASETLRRRIHSEGVVLYDRSQN